MNKLKISLPKGSLQTSTISLFQKAGIKIYTQERSYKPLTDDEQLEITLVRAQEIPKYVESGIFDCGITGYDWILETKSKVKEISELSYSKTGFRSVRWVVAVSKDSKINSIEDLKGKKVSTEIVNVVKDFFKRKNIDCKVEFSWGATEAKIPELADAIVELTETGTSLSLHNLKIIDTILVSTTRFISNFNSWKDTFKRKKMENIKILLEGALRAEDMVGLKMNVEKKNLNKILKILPALKKPTISPLTTKNWFALDTILETQKVKEILPELKRNGAQGIIEYLLNKVII